MRKIRLHPYAFAGLQLIEACYPLLFLFAALIAWWLIGGRGMSFWQFLASTAFLLLVTGSMALAYLASWMSMTFQGLAATPRYPWRIQVAEEKIIIDTRYVQVCIPKATPSAYTTVWDDNFDTLRGLEDWSLVIHLGTYLRIIVPGSSDGIDNALAKIRSYATVSSRSIE